MTKKLGVGIVGCGNIAGPYAKTMLPFPQLEFLGATDALPGRAEELTAKYGGTAYSSLEEMLADESIDLVVNLTIHHAHPEVITKCLNAGKHVHSEKPHRHALCRGEATGRYRRREGTAPKLFASHLYGRGATDCVEGDPRRHDRPRACGLCRSQLGAD